MQQEQQQQHVNALRTVPEMKFLRESPLLQHSKRFTESSIVKMGLIDEKDVLYKGPPLAGPLPSMRQLHCGDVALLKPSTDELLKRMVNKGQGMLKM